MADPTSHLSSFPDPRSPGKGGGISVIFPTLNEAESLQAIIAHTCRAAAGRAVQVVVSDCRSVDGTIDIARAAGATIVGGGVSRADAMNRGAAAASGDVLLFVHADSRLPHDFASKIDDAMACGVVGGTFDFQFGSHPRNRGLNRQALRLVAFVNRLRFRCSRVFFGDQGLFVRREVFDAVGGFPCMPLMEDAYMSRKLRRLGRTAILSPAMKTSPRRFVDRGVIRQFASDLFLITCDMLGERPHATWRRYNNVNRAANEAVDEASVATRGSPTRPPDLVTAVGG